MPLVHRLSMRLGAILVTTVSACFALAAPAMVHADAGPTDPQTHPTADITLTDSAQSRLIVAAPARHFLAGQRVHVTGRLTATSNQANLPILQDAIVRCRNVATGLDVGHVAATGRNHQGSAYTGYATQGVLPITVNWLFTAPTEGDYRCYLYGLASTTGTATPTPALTFLATSSWITMSTNDQPNATQWENTPCSSDGTSGCTYLGGSRGGVANPTSHYVFYTGQTPVSWFPTTDAVAVEALGDLSLTTCYINTASCNLSGGQLTRGSNAVVDTRLELIQLNGNGQTCVDGAGATVASYYPTTGFLRTTINDNAHHIKIHHRIPRAMINTSCRTGGQRFIVRILVRWISGQPIKIDGLQGTASQHTNAIVMQVP